MIKKILLLSLTFSAAAVFAPANINGALNGRVTDANDAAIGDLSVSLINTETGREFSAVSDETGNYSFPLVASGIYRLTVEKQNFKMRKNGTVQRVFRSQL